MFALLQPRIESFALQSFCALLHDYFFVFYQRFIDIIKTKTVKIPL